MPSGLPGLHHAPFQMKSSPCTISNEIEPNLNPIFKLSFKFEFIYLEAASINYFRPNSITEAEFDQELSQPESGFLNGRIRIINEA